MCQKCENQITAHGRYFRKSRQVLFLFSSDVTFIVGGGGGIMGGPIHWIFRYLKMSHSTHGSSIDVEQRAFHLHFLQFHPKLSGQNCYRVSSYNVYFTHSITKYFKRYSNPGICTQSCDDHCSQIRHKGMFPVCANPTTDTLLKESKRTRNTSML